MITTGKYFHSHGKIDFNQVDKTELRAEIAAINEQCRLVEENVRVRSFDDMAAEAFTRWNAPRPPRAASKRD